MAYTLAQYKSKVAEIVQDDAAKLTATELANFLQEAIKVYSKHRPRVIIKDITGDGGYDYAIATNLTSWVKGFSIVRSLEYPADERIPIYLDEGADEDFFVYEKEGGQYLRFMESSPSATEKIRVAYTALHILNDLLVEDCEDTWNEYAAAAVTAALDAVNFKVGSGSAKFTMTADAGVEILATELMSILSLVQHTHIGMWIKSSVVLNAGDLQLLLDNTAACASPLETLNIPAVAANTWTWVEMALANPATDLFLVSIGIKQAVDKGAFVLNIDDVRAFQNTIPESDQDALCNLAASLCSGALASAYAQTSDSTITADSVDHMSKSREYAARAKVQKQTYMDLLGIKEGEVLPASVIKSFDIGYPDGTDRLTHPRKR